MMVSLPLTAKLFIAMALGAIIGIERGIHQREYIQGDVNQPATFGNLGGLRTYTLIALFGALTGLMNLYSSPVYGYILAAAFFLLLSFYYIVDSFLKKATGLTSEFAAVLVFLMGFMVVTEIIPIQITVALNILICVILSYKEQIEKWTFSIKRNELEAFLGFAIISLVVLPFLPKRAFYLAEMPWLISLLNFFHISLNSASLTQVEIFNPFKLWLIVVLVVGLEILIYILSKIFGQKKGLVITSFISGFISSTFFIRSLAYKSKQDVDLDYMIAAAMFANFTSFIYFAILVGTLNGYWLTYILPFILVIWVTSLAMGLIFWYLSTKNKECISLEAARSYREEPLLIWPLMKFAFILMAVKVITRLCFIIFGYQGFIWSSLLSSFIGMDANVINLAEMAGSIITFKEALFVLLIINSANLLVKVFYALRAGNKKFALKLLESTTVVIVFSFVGYLLL